MFQVLSAGLCGLILVALFIFVTSIPEVTYSTATVGYNQNGYPEITLSDIMEVRSPSGEKLPQSEWKQVLAGRFAPVPSSEEK